jgi:hypothetical protein
LTPLCGEMCFARFYGQDVLALPLQFAVDPGQS